MKHNRLDDSALERYRLGRSDATGAEVQQAKSSYRGDSPKVYCRYKRPKKGGWE